MRRGIIVVMLGVACALAQAATPQHGLTQHEPIFAFDSLHGIAAWLRQHGREGYIGADVADAMGIPRAQGQALLAAWQRGFRNDDVLRIAQVLDMSAAETERDFILFMVQRPDDQVYFYLSTPLGGLQKAFISIPSKNLVVPLARGEAELRFQQELLYWKDRSAGP
ncbi:MAG TPA: hypothetical protein VNP36_18485 [Burkholderiales bacterium]|nr:hypothetical protein [Burkholderiales bacterium]